MFVSPALKKTALLTLLIALCGSALKVYLNLSHDAQQAKLSISLGIAVNEADTREVERLLQAGADPNEADREDSLLIATAYGASADDSALVRLLLHCGANPSKSLLAAETVNQARAVLRLGADVNTTLGYNGETPLIVQAGEGNVAVVKFLLAHGADPTLKSQDGESAVEAAKDAVQWHPGRKAEYQAILKMLESGTPASNEGTG